MRGKDLVALTAFILGAQAAGVIGSFFTAPAIPSWYASLVKPAGAPPDWIFAPVWTTLFFLMGIAAFLVWRHGLARPDVRRALFVFALQLGLNVLWSFVFFGTRNPGGAFLEILVLWLAIAATIRLFANISKTAAWLLVPYLAWVAFAAYLTYAFWTLNA